MKATIQVDINPFTVPNFAVSNTKKPTIPSDGSEPPMQCYSLSDLDSLTLDKLCRDFRDEVFRKAGKEKPPTCA